MRWSLALVTAALACSSKSDDPRPVAKDLAAKLAAAVTLAESDKSPVLCAALATVSGASKATLSRETIVKRDADVLSVETTANKSLRFAVVADARQLGAQVEATLTAIDKQLTEANVEVVFAIGGIAQREKELTAVFEKLVKKDRVLIAAPGDRESVADLDRSIAALAKAGLPAFATNQIRIVLMGGVTIALFPGVASEAGLVAGGDGCLHRDEDAAALADRLANAPGPRLWLSYAPPRGPWPSTTSDGVSAGEREQTAAIAKAKPQAVFHAQVDVGDKAPESGVIGFEATETRAVAVGSIEALSPKLAAEPSPFAGVVVSVEPGQLSWLRLRRQ